MDIPGLLVERLCCGGAFIGNPRIPHQALCIVFGIFQLAKIMFDPLRSPALAIAAFQLVKQDGDILRLSAPVTFGLDGTERAGELLGDSPRAQQGWLTSYPPRDST